MFPRLIAICGRAGSGKDTLADCLVHDRGAKKYSFALPIKQGLNAIFGWAMEQWDDREWKEAELDWLGCSPRHCAQTLGTEWGREFIDENLWVKLAMHRYQAHRLVCDDPFVIPDLRFDNEAGAVHTAGGVVVRVQRTGVAAVQAHRSEGGISEHLIDVTLQNDADIESFLRAGLATFDRWGSGL